MESDPAVRRPRARRARTDSRAHPPESEADTCRCKIERPRTRERIFVVAPADGGGWDAWKAAFLRLVDSLIAGPAHCLVLTQEPNERYVQLIVGHDGARIEVSSNHYLTGDFRLGLSDENLLTSLGFHPQEDNDPHEERTKNWWIEGLPAHPIWIAELAASALVEVAAFEPREPVSISMFGCDHPCRTCVWGHLRRLANGLGPPERKP